MTRRGDEMKNKTIGRASWLMAGALVLGVGAAMALHARAANAAEHDHAPKLMLLVSLIDTSPTRETLLEAGSGAEGEALIRIVNDRALGRYPRARAAGLLGLFPGETARRGLGAIADEASFDDIEVRVQAISALAFLEGQTGLARFTRLLEDANPEIRGAAVRALARLSSPAATAAIQNRLGSERVSWVRATMLQKLRDSREARMPRSQRP